MASFSWHSPVGRDIAAALRIFLPFVGAFLASRLIYGWISKTGRQSAGFSPTVASILTTPLLAFAYWTGSTRVFMAVDVKDASVMIGKDLSGLSDSRAAARDLSPGEIPRGKDDGGGSLCCGRR
jgi:hypothetical protein